MTMARKSACSKEWTTPFGAPPFAEITPEHFRPAFDAALAEHDAEIAAIAGRRATRRPSPIRSTRWR